MTADDAPQSIGDLLPTATPPMLRLILGATFLSGLLSLYLSLTNKETTPDSPPWQPVVFCTLVIGLWLSIEFVFNEVASFKENEEKKEKETKKTK
jgi:hypothetical protein